MKKFLFQKTTLSLAAVFISSIVVLLSSCKETSVDAPWMQ